MLQRGNVSTAIDSLADKGYLTRHPDTNDKRIIHLKLSDRSIPVVHAIEKKQDELISCIFEGFSDDEKKNFASYNKRLYDNVLSHDHTLSPEYFAVRTILYSGKLISQLTFIQYKTSIKGTRNIHEETKTSLQHD